MLQALKFEGFLALSHRPITAHLLLSESLNFLICGVQATLGRGNRHKQVTAGTSICLCCLTFISVFGNKRVVLKQLLLLLGAAIVNVLLG